MMIIFIDSGLFRALYNSKDQYFSQAILRFQKAKVDKNKFVVTDYILDESYTGILVSSNYKNVMEFDKLFRRSNIKIEKITPERFAKAQEVFRKYNKDKKWSFTDCTSYVVMKELRLKKILTFDKNFEEMGFEVI